MSTRKSTTRASEKTTAPRKSKAQAAPARKAASKSAATKRKRPAKSESQANVWTLRLYISGRGERSERALRNLRSLCEANMKEGTYKIEVIDLLKNPALAKADQILAIPTLVRKLPEPMKRIIGDLSDADRALLSLDLPKQQ
ncbi:MAG TPA: circadian clock KaiB family protein [Polyangiales bacterium]|nr:circadian clock KaiB family protein [Polyangiales bacterium]